MLPCPARIPRRALAALLAVALAGAEARAATLGGTIELRDRDRPAADVAGAVVAWEPAARAGALPRRDGVIHTRNKRFEPRVLPVTTGSSVAFPNSDPILHNVFSVSPGNRFDVGLYRQGPGKTVSFANPGLVRVYCNVHQAMVAYVVVLDTPHYAVADAQGRFTLEGLPDGPGTLTVWHERAAPFRREMPAPEGPVAVTLATVLAKLPPHLDKHGRPYDSDRTRERYR